MFHLHVDRSAFRSPTFPLGHKLDRNFNYETIYAEVQPQRELSPIRAKNSPAYLSRFIENPFDNPDFSDDISDDFSEDEPDRPENAFADQTGRPRSSCVTITMGASALCSEKAAKDRKGTKDRKVTKEEEIHTKLTPIFENSPTTNFSATATKDNGDPEKRREKKRADTPGEDEITTPKKKRCGAAKVVGYLKGLLLRPREAGSSKEEDGDRAGLGALGEPCCRC